MKFVRNMYLSVLVLALAIGVLFVVPGSEARAQYGPFPRPCQQPSEFTTPIELTSSTDSTQPRLMTEWDARAMHVTNPVAGTGLSIEWSFSGWTDGSTLGGEVLFSGLWALPRTGALTFGGGWGALVTVEAGDVVLLVCGQDGEIDTTPNDGQSMALPAGSSTPLAQGTSFYVFLSEAPASYWLFGNRTGQPVESAVSIQIIGTNGGPQVCGLSTCWPAPVLSGRPNYTNCDNLTCDYPPSPGGCGGIRCWTK